MTLITERMLVCSICGEAPFEQPPCEDGHGADCPEWICTACGLAILVEPPSPAEPLRVPRAA